MHRTVTARRFAYLGEDNRRALRYHATYDVAADANSAWRAARLTLPRDVLGTASTNRISAGHL
jgi:hypothetical protein